MRIVERLWVLFLLCLAVASVAMSLHVLSASGPAVPAVQEEGLRRTFTPHIECYQEVLSLGCLVTVVPTAPVLIGPDGKPTEDYPFTVSSWGDKTRRPWYCDLQSSRRCGYVPIGSPCGGLVYPTWSAQNWPKSNYRRVYKEVDGQWLLGFAVCKKSTI